MVIGELENWGFGDLGVVNCGRIMLNISSYTVYRLVKTSLDAKDNTTYSKDNICPKDVSTPLLHGAI